MKRRMFALLLTGLMCLSLAACGAKSEAAAPSAEAPAASAPMMEEAYYYGADMEMSMTDSAVTGGSKDGVVSGQKLIRTASLELETMEFESTNAALNELVAQMGGYMENSNLRNRSSGYRYAEYILRIPAERYEEFLNQAGTLCHETWRSTSQEDISEMYYDTQGRLKTQQIKLERLQDLLARAESMEDIITIESAISETEMLIDSYSGTLRHYDGKVDYATVNISLREVYKYSNTEEAPTGFVSRLSNSFSNGWSNFVDAMEDLAVSLAYGWMWWVILGAAAFVGFRVARKKIRLPGRKKAEKADDNHKEI